MSRKRKWLCAAVALWTLGGTWQAQAAVPAQQAQAEAVADETVEAKKPAPPVTIEGDEISFDQTTGDVYARGNVVITQQDARLTAEDIHGNTQAADVWLDGKGHLTQQARPAIDLDGYDAFYNYQRKEGYMRDINGRADEKYVQGKKIEFFPDEIIVYDGRVTKCPAKKPDYYVTAKKIEIWPNERMVAHDAKFWVKGKVLYATKRYETGIGENRKENSAFPRVGYNTDDGVYIRQRFEHPLSDDLAAYATLGYYTKHDFKGEGGVVWRKPRYEVSLSAGDFQDDDDDWIKKEPELRFDLFKQQIGTTPYYYQFTALYGRWSDDKKRSWHQEYEAYLSRAPIALSNTLNLHLGTGYEFVRESYDNSKANSIKYDVTLSNKFSPRLTAWTGYHYTKNNAQDMLFNYDNADVAKELASGLRYKLDDKNTLLLEHSYDIENNRTEDMDYTWERDLHCLQMKVTFREKRDEWKVKFDVTKW